MITIKPFKAWRPKPEELLEIACVPYDVINTEEARQLAEGKPKSFLHVIRPEIDLPEGVDEHSDEVYNKGAENLNLFCKNGTLVQEENPSLYLYRLIWKGRSQTGLFTCVSVQDYDNNLILKHELTRPDKEDDRTRHIITQQAHAEPVMLTYKGTEKIDTMVSSIMKDAPLYNFTADDGVQHTIWRTPASQEFVDAFKKVGALYVADGHHRCKSASRAVEQMKEQNPNHTGQEEYNFFPAVVIPMDQMEILAYNRVIHSVEPSVFERMKSELNLVETKQPIPQKKGTSCAYYNGKWYSFTLPIAQNPDAVQVLDAARLQHHVLETYFGISNPRTDKNISFIGGIRGTKELERLVDSGKAQLGFSMYPTSIQELIDVSDAGQLMPPKCTWFEPKLRSGLLVHTF
jgi:uncharacterized protein (DUF1015 family)